MKCRKREKFFQLMGKNVSILFFHYFFVTTWFSIFESEPMVLENIFLYNMWLFETVLAMVHVK